MAFLRPKIPQRTQKKVRYTALAGNRILLHNFEQFDEFDYFTHESAFCDSQNEILVQNFVLGSHSFYPLTTYRSASIISNLKIDLNFLRKCYNLETSPNPSKEVVDTPA